MSRIGRQLISLPAGVEVRVEDHQITVSGPKGSLSKSLPAEFKVSLNGPWLKVTSSDGSREEKSLWGLYRNLIANMVEGVSRGFSKELELSGIGFKVKMDGSDLIFSLGFSHPLRFSPSSGVAVQVKEENKIIILGADKELVGQEAARMRDLKKPEPYKGKGIRYRGELVRRKAGKVGKVGSSLGSK